MISSQVSATTLVGGGRVAPGWEQSSCQMPMIALSVIRSGRMRAAASRDTSMAVSAARWMRVAGTSASLVSSSVLVSMFISWPSLS